MRFLPAGMSPLDLVLVLIAALLGVYAGAGPVRTLKDRNAQTALIIIFLPITIMTVRYCLDWIMVINGVWSTPGATAGRAASALQTFSGQSLSSLYTESLIAAIFVAFAMRILVGSSLRRNSQSSDGHDAPMRGTIMSMNLEETKEDHAQGTRRRRAPEHQARD